MTSMPDGIDRTIAVIDLARAAPRSACCAISRLFYARFRVRWPQLTEEIMRTGLSMEEAGRARKRRVARQLQAEVLDPFIDDMTQVSRRRSSISLPARRDQPENPDLRRLREHFRRF
jgi:hypothetical protein